jgi:DNA-binding GntR family transcriptional regulator
MSKAGEHVYLTLRRRIMSGHYSPGAQLKEEGLASELEVSRTPVRAALQRLIGDGLVIGHSNRGAFVAEWTTRDIGEIYELRSLLEAHAAALAAERRTPQQVAEMSALTDRMEELYRHKPRDYLAEIQNANQRFHLLILEASGSPRLKTMARNLVDTPIIIGAFYFYADEDLARSVQHHRDLVRAIDARNRELAKQIMNVHLGFSHQLFMQHRQRNNGDDPKSFAGDNT